MGVHEEVVKTFNMVKNAGFEVIDVVFEGAVTVKGKDLLSQLETLAKDRKAMGIIRIVYSAGEEQLRTIEIPVGEALPEVEREEELPSV